MTPDPQAAMAVVAAVLVLAASLHLGRRHPMLVAGAVAATGAVVAVTALVTEPRHAPDGPLGYANASAAVCIAAAAGALLLHLRARTPVARAATLTATLALLAMPAWFRSRAGTAGALVVGAGLVAHVRHAGPRRISLVGAGLLVAVNLATVTIAATWQPDGGLATRAGDALVGVRAELWHDAWRSLMARPLGGGTVGPLVADAGFERFAHSALLHAGAVAGIGGIVVLVVAAATTYAGLARGSDPTTVVAALAFTALGIQASVDYVAHFALVLTVFAALVGVGLGRARAPIEQETS